MDKQEVTIWGVHAGEVGQADGLFKKNYIALGWDEMGDLSKLPADRESFKNKVAECYPDSKPGAIPNVAGQLFRFVHEMQPGDLVIYPSKLDRQVHLGRVEGPYTYGPALDVDYPHLRLVTWLKAVPRTHFTQGVLNEIGAAITFFQVRTYAEEFRAVFEPSVTANARSPLVSLDQSASEHAPSGRQIWWVNQGTPMLPRVPVDICGATH